MPAIPPGIILRPTKTGKPRYGVKVYDRSIRNGRWVGTFGSLEEARAAKRRAEAGRHTGEAMTVEEYADDWPRVHPRPTESTMDRYVYSLKPFRERFGKRKMHSITRVEALEWAATVSCGVTDTVRVFLNARNDGLITYNPFSDLRRKRPAGRSDLEVISTRELGYLADTATEVWPDLVGITMRALILWAAYTAMRPAEIFALQWAWLDFSAHEVAVMAQLDRRGRPKPPKNGEQRIIVMLPEAAAAIKSVPRELATSRDIVFRTSRLGLFSLSKLHYYWDPIRAAFGKPEMDFYELRHYCATLMVENGVAPADVAIQLGHRDGGALVMKTYGHPSEDVARSRILRLMNGRKHDIRPSKSAGFRPPDVAGGGITGPAQPH